MRLTPNQLSELESLAIQAANRAGQMIQSKSAHDHEILNKEGGSSLASQVVTAIDLESERLILETLEQSLDRFKLGLLTEESPDNSSRHTMDYFWCIDPLDGTLAFTRGSPGYSVSIALIARDGTPLIGVVLDPVTGTLYHAVQNKGAFKNGSPWSAAPSLPGSPLSLMVDNSFVPKVNEPDFRNQLEDLSKSLGHHGLRIVDHAGSVLNACQVADQTPALYFKFPKQEPGGGSLWDFAATTCLFKELGLPVSDIKGQPLLLNPTGCTFMNKQGVLYASTPEIASAVDSLRS